MLIMAAPPKDGALEDGPDCAYPTASLFTESHWET